MAGDLLLIGSIPLDTPEQVFRRVGAPLGPYLAYMPDGEVGDRRYWIDGIAYRFSTAILRSKRYAGRRPTRTAWRVGGRWECMTSFSSASNPASRRCASAIRGGGSATRKMRSARISCSDNCRRKASFRRACGSRCACR